MHATWDDIVSAYKMLIEEDFESIHDYAARRIRGTSFAEPDDLIQETMTRILAGSRKWPLRAPFGLFLRLAMHSVAQAKWAQRDKGLVVQMPEDFDIDTRLADVEAGSPVELRLLALERLQQAHEAVALAREALGEDFAAQGAIDGILWDTHPRETRAKLGISERDFDAARQRARRRLREAVEIIKQRDGQRAVPASKPCQNPPSESFSQLPHLNAGTAVPPCGARLFTRSSAPSANKVAARFRLSQCNSRRPASEIFWAPPYQYARER